VIFVFITGNFILTEYWSDIYEFNNQNIVGIKLQKRCVMANKQARKRMADLARQVRGAERRADAMSLRDIAGQAAAGHLSDDEEDIDAGGAIFQPDVDTGLETPSGGVWSFGPPQR